jgi:hypothetical protein
LEQIARCPYAGLNPSFGSVGFKTGARMGLEIYREWLAGLSATPDEFLELYESVSHLRVAEAILHEIIRRTE